MDLAVTTERPVLETLSNLYSSGKCPTGVGAIEIVSRSSRIAARIYVKNHHVVGLEISNFPLEIIRRIITSEHISDVHRDFLLEHFADNLADGRIVDYVVENQMIPMSVLVVYIKDLFLGACDYIGSIPMAEISWRPNVEYKKVPIPEVELDRLWTVVNNRKNEYKRMADVFTVGEHQVRDLYFKRKGDIDMEDITQLSVNILSLASGEWSILDFARQFGLSLYLSTREIQKMWTEGYLDIIYDGEFKLKPPVDTAPKPISTIPDVKKVEQQKNIEEIKQLEDELNNLTKLMEETKQKLDQLKGES